MERELQSVQATSNELVTKASNGSLSAEDTLKSIDSMIGKVEGLKRKVGTITSKMEHKFLSNAQLSDLHETAGKPTQDVMRERLHHLATVEALQSPNQPEFSRWADIRLDRWLVDWCLRAGKDKSAKSIAKEKGIEVYRSRLCCLPNDLISMSTDTRGY